MRSFVVENRLILTPKVSLEGSRRLDQSPGRVEPGRAACAAASGQSTLATASPQHAGSFSVKLLIFLLSIGRLHRLAFNGMRRPASTVQSAPETQDPPAMMSCSRRSKSGSVYLRDSHNTTDHWPTPCHWPQTDECARLVSNAVRPMPKLRYARRLYAIAS